MPELVIAYQHGWRVVQVRQEGRRRSIRTRLASEQQAAEAIREAMARLQRLIDRMNRELGFEVDDR